MEYLHQGNQVFDSFNSGNQKILIADYDCYQYFKASRNVQLTNRGFK